MTIEKIKNPKPPRGVMRWLARAPIRLFRWRLGWILGGRFVLINHVGRKSGLPRRVVVEVVRHDKAGKTIVVASGFGEKAHWYRNLQKTPDVTIQLGTKKYAAHAEFLSTAQGAEEMETYARRHPTAARELSKFMGYRVDGSPESYRAVGESIPFVALKYH